jgi:hypothetical protein
MQKGIKKGEKDPKIWGEGTRCCAKCKTFKPFSDFHKFKDSIQGTCKTCMYQRTQGIKASVRKHIQAIKTATPCADCGICYPYYVMDFDHMRDKKFNVARGTSAGWRLETIIDEVAKCEIVCANCHRMRTFRRSK